MPRLVRRSFLTQLGAAAMLTPLLAACQQQAAPSSPQRPAPAPPPRARPSKPAEAARPAVASRPAADARRPAPAPSGAKPGVELGVAREAGFVPRGPPMATDVYSGYVYSQIH